MQTRSLSCDADGISVAAKLLRAGELVAIPTETVYGLAADATNANAVAAIYAAKDRPAFNPLIVHVGSLDEAVAIAHLNEQAMALARAFWPGALTLVLPLRPRSEIADLVTAGGDHVAVRVPAHPAARAILGATGKPLAAPSANPSGRISPTRAEHVLDPIAGLGGRIAAVVDAGPCTVGVESSIVGWQDDRCVLMRPGGIAADRIETILGETVYVAVASGTPKAPGQLASHYAPSMPLRMNAAAAGPGETLITFGEEGDYCLSPTGDLTEAAVNLFDVLRRADMPGKPIVVQPIPDEGIGQAINDRLSRAAAPR